ncbi:diguanylate cyclase domain-containing protein [Pokkaliibacter sp. CJK22405]|uniref:GGDEF domain-containing protein n=1 Tax=Pokkaliibacter sp. CJK22405 TaxID=3384615 RepID=UPI0039847092
MSSTDTQDWKSRYYELLSELNEAELDAENKLKLFTALVRKLAQHLALDQPHVPRWGSLVKALQNVPDASMLTAWVEQVDAPLPADHAIQTPEEQDTADTLVRRIRHWLLRQVQPVMGELQHHPDLLNLIDELEGQDSPEVVERTLQSLLTVLFSQLGQQNRELENYLQEISRHLQMMQRYVDTELLQQRSARAETATFTSDLQQDMGDLRQEVRDATNLSVLQSQVEERLKGLTGYVESYRTAHEKRAQHWQQRHNEMEKRLKSLEVEHERLQGQLEDQHQRMQQDALTGLPNRMAYDMRLRQLFSDFQQQQRPFALLVGDLDFFKAINDQYGHLAGDKVLKIMAKTLRPLLRKEDLLARIGGEEFVFLLPGLGRDTARQFAEKVRLTASGVGFHFRGVRVSVSLSVGIAISRQGDDAAKLFERADQALYEAKRNGRNQVCVESDTDKATRKR